jgi:glycosyltransferase involved in cell wall biosynthesis
MKTPHPPTTNSHPLTTTSHPPTTNSHPPTTNYHPPTTNYHPPTTNYHPPTTNYHPPTTNYHPPTTKIAIISDWLTNMGGAERVILELHNMFPEAPIYTSTYEAENMPLFKGADIRTAWFQKLPKAIRKHQLLTLPRQWYFGHLKLKGYDIVISASGAEAKAVRAPNGKHINICFTPTQYYWVRPDEYLQKDSLGPFSGILRAGLKLFMPFAKRWDLTASTRPDVMYAISTEVQKRIKTFYGRDSELLYPPADIDRFTHGEQQKRSGFVIFGRQVHHKRIDLAIAACNKIGAKLVVIGNGPEHDKLVTMAGPTIEFKTNVSDEEMVRYVGAAEAFIFPNEEDYGIVAVEAMAAGTPVIAYRAGGALDTVKEGLSGEFFNAQTVECLAKKLEQFNPSHYDPEKIKQWSKNFSAEKFRNSIKNIVADFSK